MLRNGIYEAAYSGASYAARGVFVFSNGTFIGVGQTGAVYEGVYWITKDKTQFVFDGAVRFKPGTELVTDGSHAGADGLTLPFKGSAPVPNPECDFILSLNGLPVDVKFTFVSPLP